MTTASDDDDTGGEQEWNPRSSFGMGWKNPIGWKSPIHWAPMTGNTNEEGDKPVGKSFDHWAASGPSPTALWRETKWAQAVTQMREAIATRLVAPDPMSENEAFVLGQITGILSQFPPEERK